MLNIRHVAKKHESRVCPSLGVEVITFNSLKPHARDFYLPLWLRNFEKLNSCNSLLSWSKYNCVRTYISQQEMYTLIFLRNPFACFRFNQTISRIDKGSC